VAEDGGIVMYVFSFDVESMGLHGIGFAVGWAVFEVTHSAVGEHNVKEVDSGYLGFDHKLLEYRTNEETLKWLNEHVFPVLPEPNCLTLTDVRRKFWDELQKWEAEGAIIIADCGWPVETNFMSQCMTLSGVPPFDGPYPLHDVATMLLAAGMDPLGEYGRLENELPKHNPTADARQSARMWFEASNSKERG